jgi:hypothetical protein
LFLCLILGVHSTLVDLLITTKKQALPGADMKMPGTPFGPGTLREFQFSKLSDSYGSVNAIPTDVHLTAFFYVITVTVQLIIHRNGAH